ncbi:hypothetical protein BDW22DRAFT_1348271 [Trametopsis cervina]|nr:hypothetical protein BDW22DRAFT_1348271 [Trametopsis cervina]
MRYKKLRVFGGRGRKNLLDDEDDDWVIDGGSSGGGPGIGAARYPPSVASSSSRYRGAMSNAIPMDATRPSPYYAGVPGLHSRSTSGSIFHEQLLPTVELDYEQSRLIDHPIATILDAAGLNDRPVSVGRDATIATTKTASSHGGSSSHYPETQRSQSVHQPPQALKEQWDLARSQSPDSMLYDFGTLAVCNTDPTSPTGLPPPAGPTHK